MLLTVLGFQPSTPAKMFFCEFSKNFKNIFWQNTSGWLLLVFICQFWEVFQIISFVDENLFRLMYDTKIYIQIHIRCFKSLPIATYHLTTIHVKNLYLRSMTYNMALKKFITEVTFPLRLGKSVNPNIRYYQFYRDNQKFTCCCQIQ